MTKKIKKKPWPTKEAMNQVYELNLWGKGDSEFYSGEGSHQSYIVDPYISVVASFIQSLERKPVICDLGCGDFNVGKRLVELAEEYIAVDIVPNLIERNKTLFNSGNLEFHCLDIALDQLPKGDCVIIRQVLQHLSNSEIEKIVSKLSAFKYVILTEHVPEGEFEPNKDIISGQGIRISQFSGVDLLAPPFNFQVKNSIELLRVKQCNFRGEIVTTLFTLF